MAIISRYGYNISNYVEVLQELYIETTLSAVDGSSVSPGAGGKITFAIDGTLEAGESIPIEIKVYSNWVAVVEDGVAIALTADTTVIATDKPGVYRVVKPITTNSVGVIVYR